jgi:TPP-dependent pyruvate/acetoin dehydrogenase alpha subunit
MTKEELQAFEEDIADIYKTGSIRGPIHLRDNTEDFLIELYKDINKEDYVFTTWANHIEAILKLGETEPVKERILSGDSMAMNFRSHNFFTSAIVSGVSPIAVGVAYALKLQNKSNKVYCIIGDMAFLTGGTNECIRYSINFDLPLHWVILDNDKSVCTPTRESWGGEDLDELIEFFQNRISRRCNNTKLTHYKYTSKFEHSGVGAFVAF